jgi:hypothetical protein
VKNALQDCHGFRCAQAVAKKSSADADSVVTVSPDTPNVLQAMMQLRQVKSRSETANKFPLDAEKERDADEKAVEELKRQLQPKRARTDDDAGDAHEMLAEVDNWDLRDHRQQSTRVQNLMVQGCTRTKQTFWTEDELTVTSSPGIWNRDVRVAEIAARELEKAKPDKWGCVQAHELWSPQEERQVRPGHFWLLKFDKVPGSNSCVEKEFKLGTRQYEEYKGVRFDNGDCVLLVDVWLHRVDEDVSGLTFEEWDP